MGQLTDAVDAFVPVDPPARIVAERPPPAVQLIDDPYHVHNWVGVGVGMVEKRTGVANAAGQQLVTQAPAVFQNCVCGTARLVPIADPDVPEKPLDK